MIGNNHPPFGRDAGQIASDLGVKRVEGLQIVLRALVIVLAALRIGKDQGVADGLTIELGIAHIMPCMRILAMILSVFNKMKRGDFFA